MIDRFADDAQGGFFATASDHEQLVVRRKDIEDNPIPSGSSSAALGLLRLAALTGEASYEQLALTVLRPLAELAGRFPTSFGHLLQALAFHLEPVREVAIVGDEPGPLLGAVRAQYRPQVVLAGSSAADAVASAVPLLEGRGPVDGRTAAYVCVGFACQAPVTDADALTSQLT